MKKYILIIISLAFILKTNAQNQPILIKKSNDGYELRWTPQTPEIWLYGLENGYQVERKNASGTYKKISSTPIKPRVLSNGDFKNEAERYVNQIWQKRDSAYAILKMPKRRNEVENIFEIYKKLLLEVEGGVENSGLYFEDKTAETGEKYDYRISIFSKPNDFSATKNTSNAVAEPKFGTLITRSKNEFITLTWQELNEQNYISLPFLNRAENGSDFENLTPSGQYPLPDISTSKVDTFRLTDSVANMEKVYFYQLSGRDFFGDFFKGKIIKASGKDVDAPARPTEFTVKGTAQKRVNLNWKKEQVETDFIGFNIYRSEVADSGYILLNQKPIPPTTRSYSDTYNGSNSWIFYKISAIDKNKNEGFTTIRNVIFADKTPPEIPQNLTAEIDKSGVVKINWSPSKSNDIMGYRLASSRNAEARFVPVTQEFISKNEYTDTLALNFINRAFFYKIAAIDDNFNISEFSVPIQILLPDTIAPISPILEKITLEKERAVLNWKPGSDSDISNFKILRKTSSAEDWTTISTIENPKITTYLDQPGEGNFEYAVQVTDESGNLSKISNSRFLRISKPAETAAISDLKYEVLDDKKIQLNWNFPKTQNQYAFLIFRKSSGQAEAEFVTSVLNNSVIDRKIKKGEVYEYFVVAKSDKGLFLPPSENIKVNF